MGKREEKEQLEDFREVIGYYEKLIQILNSVKNGKVTNDFYKILKNFEDEMNSEKYILASYRIICLNESLDLYKYIEKKKEKHEYIVPNCSIEELEDLCKGLNTNDNCDVNEKFSRLRNSLAHAQYEISIDEDFNLNDIDIRKIKLHINNNTPKSQIEGDITYRMFTECLEAICGEYHLNTNINHLSELYSNYYDKNKGKVVFTRKSLRNLLDSKDLCINGHMLSDNAKKNIINYIENYITINNFNELDETYTYPADFQGTILKNLIEVMEFQNKTLWRCRFHGQYGKRFY